ncbi:MAG TPA: succinyldiaminopimelate transaminase [Steroidobacteraceae bacterium]|nr:succinyldiaminopimelate transaminase [Steroidobacteraceae bacterium]
MNPHLAQLQAYPFERLARLLAGARPPDQLSHIGMSIGEPRHQPPQLVLEALAASVDQLGSYPATKGLPLLREAMAASLQRVALPPAARVDAERMVLPVTGTREALFSLIQCIVDPKPKALVAMPNPAYQIYEGAAILAGAEPYYMNCTQAGRFVPTLEAVPAAIWQRCQLLILCSPGNPTGAALNLAYLRAALDLAERYDFVIAADECYADLYLDELAPPPSLLRAAHEAGQPEFARCVIFRSLSKRSSVPGLRSGFVAGDPALMERFLLYRTYHGCAMPLPTQLASIPAWRDEQHVIENRALYREKFDRVLPILQPVLDVQRPDGAFYLWPDVHGDDLSFARQVYEQCNVTILPGSFMARDTPTGNPGVGRVRISLVPGVADCVEAAERLRDFLRRRPAH